VLVSDTLATQNPKTVFLGRAAGSVATQFDHRSAEISLVPTVAEPVAPLSPVGRLPGDPRSSQRQRRYSYGQL